MTSVTDELRRLLTERGVKWEAPNSCQHDEMTIWTANKFEYEAIETPYNGFVLMATHQEELSPDKAIAATLGGPTWRNSYDQQRYDQWYNSLFHGEPSSLKELIEDVIWTTETVDLGPNGNECQGVDEGEVQTESVIATWAKKAATLGGGTLTAEQVREAIYSGSTYTTYDGARFHASGIDMQAIADELNAVQRNQEFSK